MGAAYFYHLTETPLEVTLPTLLEKARGAGWRVVVRGTSVERLDWLDRKLWTGSDDGFLPHGRAGGGFDADQPVLLTEGHDFPNRAGCLMVIDGAEPSADEVSTLERVCVIFDGNDQKSLETARNQWKALSEAGCALQYWAQEGGGWKKKAEKA